MATVLLVDDHAGERRLLYHALKREHRVLETAEADVALALLSVARVDVVVLDMHLHPVGNGVPDGERLHARMRAQGHAPAVVVVTGDQDLGLERRMRQAGVAAYLSKPVDPDELRRTIARALP